MLNLMKLKAYPHDNGKVPNLQNPKIKKRKYSLPIFREKWRGAN